MESHSRPSANIDHPLRVTSPALAKRERKLLLLPENKIISLLRKFKLPTNDQKPMNDIRPLMQIFDDLDVITKQRMVLANAKGELNEDQKIVLSVQEDELRTKVLINLVKDANLMDIHKISLMLRIARNDIEASSKKLEIDRLLMLREMMRLCIIGKSLHYTKDQLAILKKNEDFNMTEAEMMKYDEINIAIFKFYNKSINQHIASLRVEPLLTKSMTFIDKTIEALDRNERPLIRSKKQTPQKVLQQRAHFRHQLISVKKTLTNISKCFVHDANQASLLEMQIEKLHNLKKEAKASQLGLTSKTLSYLQTGISLLLIVPAIVRSIHNKITYGTGRFWKSSLYKESKLAEKRVEKIKGFFPKT